MGQHLMKTSSSKINILFFALGIATILIIWEVLNKTGNDFVVPSISSVLKDTVKLLTDGKSLLLIGKTIIKLLLVVFISFVISFVLAILSYKSNKFKNYISPVISLIRTIPVATFVVILLILIGSKKSPIIITLFVLIPIIYEALLNSFQTIDKDIVEETKLISNINLRIILIIYLPIKIKNILSTLLSSFGLGLKVLIMSEVITQSSNTIGGIIANEKGSFFNMTRVFSWTLILIIMIMIIELLIRICEKKIGDKII